MLIFGGINFPLAEFLLVLAVIFTFAIIYFAHHLRKLEKLTHEEKDELLSLEKMAQEEKAEIDKMANFENAEKEDLLKFEAEIKELEEDTETIYLKKLVPDVYKLQNYVLFSLKKGIPPDEIKQTLLSKGWKDKKLVDMVINDMSKYVSYYRGAKGEVALPLVTVQEKTQIIQPTKIVEKPAEGKVAPPKKHSTHKAPAKKSFTSVEKEIQKIEKDLKKSEKALKKPLKSTKISAKKSDLKVKKPETKKVEAKKADAKKPEAKAKKPETKKVEAKKADAKKPEAKAKKSEAKKDAKKPEAKAEAKPRSLTVLATKDGDKFHDPTCIVLKNIKKEEVVSFPSKEEAMKKGYKPCNVCSISMH